MQYIAYRNLVGVTHTEAEAKAEAEEIQVNYNLKHIGIPISQNYVRLGQRRSR